MYSIRTWLCYLGRDYIVETKWFLREFNVNVLVDFFYKFSSWGTGWGEQGYIRIIRNKGMAPSCGLTTYANYVVA